jgi:glycosyltransferase involved in cell wall biosynthesis
MAMGKAVLASDVGGHKELIDNERTGVLFKAENSDDLVAQSVRLARDTTLRAELGEAGRRFVNNERSWAKLAERYVDIYSQLLATKN